MSGTIEKFDFKIAKMKKGDEIPMNPIVQITLKKWGRDESNVPIISEHLMSEVEIDQFIAHCKDDLDLIGRRAKAALRKAHAETKDLLS